MTKLVVRRLALGVLTLWLISLVVFAAVVALPGDAATAILGRTASPDRVAALREQLHLNESVVSQYLHWVGGVLTGSFGESAATQQPVSQLLSDRVADHVTSTTTLVLAALPEFVIGILLILVFATSVFHWFPAVSLLAPGQHAWADPNVVVLPAATLVLAVTPYISRIMRGSMIEVLESEYVTMARLKGLSERRVIWAHAVPNAIVPAIQVTALQLAWMAGGVVMVEFVFSYPGIGAALVDSVDKRDIPVVQTVTMLAAGVYVLLNLLADLATILVTPKLRTATR